MISFSVETDVRMFCATYLCLIICPPPFVCMIISVAFRLFLLQLTAIRAEQDVCRLAGDPETPSCADVSSACSDPPAVTLSLCYSLYSHLLSHSSESN